MLFVLRVVCLQLIQSFDLCKQPLYLKSVIIAYLHDAALVLG